MSQDISEQFQPIAEEFCQKFGYRLLTREEYRNMPRHDNRIRLASTVKFAPSANMGISKEWLNKFQERLENCNFIPNTNQIFIEFFVMQEHRRYLHYALDIYQYVVIDQ